MAQRCWKPLEPVREKSSKGEDLFRDAVLPMREIIRVSASECPEAVPILKEAQEVLWTKTCELTDEDQDFKDEYLAGEQHGTDGDYIDQPVPDSGNNFDGNWGA